MPGGEIPLQGKDTEGPERGETTERSKESEIKANLEFWRDLGIEIDEADVREKVESLPEVEGFNWYFYMPKGITASQLISEMRKIFRFPVQMSTDTPDPSLDIGDPDKFEMPRNASEKSYVVAARYQQEPDKESLGEENAKSSKDWESTKETFFMTALERIVAEMRWYKETGSHLDLIGVTLTPGCRAANGEVPSFTFHQDRIYPEDDFLKNVYITSYGSGLRNPNLGVRRIVYKELES